MTNIVVNTTAVGVGGWKSLVTLGRWGLCSRKGSHIFRRSSVDEMFLLPVPEGTEGFTISFVFFIIVKSLAPVLSEV